MELLQTSKYILTLVIINHSQRLAFSHQKLIILGTIVIFLFLDVNFLRMFRSLVILIDNLHPNSAHILILWKTSVYLNSYHAILISCGELSPDGEMVGLVVAVGVVLCKERVVVLGPEELHDEDVVWSGLPVRGESPAH